MPEEAAGCRLLFVINPISGGGNKAAYMEAIAAHCANGDAVYEWYELSGDHAADQSSLRHWVKDWKPDRVIALGGDGTLKFLAETLMNTGMPVAFVPAGSANGMARELGLPAEPAEAIRVAAEGKPRKMDVVMLNGECSIHLADLGLNAQLVKHFEQSDRRGWWGYAREILKVMRSKEKARFEITADGKTTVRDAWMVVIANSRYYGTGVPINPDGSVHDGRFEIVVLKQFSVWEILARTVLRYRRKNKNVEEIISAKEATIRLSKPLYFQVDGEYIDEVREVRCEMKAGAVEMVMGDA